MSVETIYCLFSVQH